MVPGMAAPEVPYRSAPGAPSDPGARARGGKRIAIISAVLLGLTTLSACGQSGSSGAASTSGSRVVQVVAAENFWGSIASQIGGKHAQVVSIITNPNTDPHAYEPTAGDARTLAESQLVVENGIGYDPWVPKLLAADQGDQTVLDVGSLLGVPDGGNPHRWYNPGDVREVVGRLVSDLTSLDPADRAYFKAQAAHFEHVSLGPYDAAIAAIRAKYSGTPVGASESIFAMLAPALGLHLITPATFLKAISEGSDVSVGDKETIDNQIKNHLIKIYVYNSQNVTPDVQAQLNEVKAEHIPVATITETLQPAKDSYQAWQTRQLMGIEAALAKAHG
jgi:zinc/manganese transport system substrate-binding protein